MKEILLCKFGEIVLKGANRRFFEDTLCRTLRFRAKHFGSFEIKSSQSTITITPLDDFCDIDGMYESVYGRNYRAGFVQRREDEYNKKQSLIITKNNRADLYSKHKLTKKEEKALNRSEEYFDNIVNKSLKKK